MKTIGEELVRASIQYSCNIISKVSEFSYSPIGEYENSEKLETSENLELVELPIYNTYAKGEMIWNDGYVRPEIGGPENDPYGDSQWHKKETLMAT